MKSLDRHVLTPEQAQRLLATCAGDSPIDLRDRAMFVVGLETGMRRMSLAGMNLEAIHRDDGYPVALVPIKGSRGALYPVPLTDAVMLTLEPWRKWLRSQKITKGPVFRGLTRKIARGGKLVYEVGDDLALVSIYKIVKHRAEQAGLDNIHPHLFHDTFVAWRAQAGFTSFQIAAITGHKFARMPADSVSFGRFEVRQQTPGWLANLVRKS